MPWLLPPVAMHVDVIITMIIQPMQGTQITRQLAEYCLICCQLLLSTSGSSGMASVNIGLSDQLSNMHLGP